MPRGDQITSTILLHLAQSATDGARILARALQGDSEWFDCSWAVMVLPSGGFFRGRLKHATPPAEIANHMLTIYDVIVVDLATMSIRAEAGSRHTVLVGGVFAEYELLEDAEGGTDAVS